ncbi:adenylate cyclase CyaK [soil metagenome]
MFKVRPPSTRLRWQALAVGVSMLVVLVTSVTTPFVGVFNLYLQDWLLRQTTTKPLPKDFVLVAIDDRSLDLGDLEPGEVDQSKALQLMKAPYPWSREVYAPLVEKLFNAGARIVIFDVVFSSSRPGDDAFAEALSKYPGRVILASSIQTGEALYKVPAPLLPTPVLLKAVGRLAGLANFPPWRDNKVRSIFLRATPSEVGGHAPLLEDEYPTLTAVAAQALGVSLPEGIGSRPLRFRYSVPGTVTKVPLYEIFVPAFWKANLHDGSVFKDRIVLVGATSPVLHDSHPTPIDGLSKDIIYGPEIQLHALAALLHGDFLGQTGPAATVISVVLAALAVFVTILVRRNIVWFALGLVCAAIAWLIICAVALHFFSYFLPAAPPFLTILTCGFAVLICDVTLERQERGRLRSTFALYVSKDIVQEIVDNKESFLQKLGGQRQEIVVLFSDLKGFTSDAERLDPVEMVTMLNEYFGEMVNVVFKYHGTFDKFIGDALMATWGCMRKASPQEDARNALMAAFEMKTRLMALNESRRERGITPWGSGVGICQGPAIFGNIGSLERMEPTVIGDTVNLASRIEGLTRIYGVDLLVAERFATNLPAAYGLLHVDTVRVKGRRAPERLFHPYDKALLDPAWATAFTAAREKYTAGDFDGAGAAFASLSHEKGPHGLAHLYQHRCEGLIVTPRESWEGIWDFAEK